MKKYSYCDRHLNMKKCLYLAHVSCFGQGCRKPAAGWGGLKWAAMSQLFLHNDGNRRRRIYETVVPKKVYPLCYGSSFYPLLVSFRLKSLTER